MTSLSRSIALVFIVGAVCLLGACAHTPSPAEEGLGSSAPPSAVADPLENEGQSQSVAAPPPIAESGPAKRPEERCEALLGEQRVKRAAVNEVVAAGLGRWLQGVQIERVLENKKFKGWRIGALHLENPCYAAVDLRPGDIVTGINGQGPKALERPESAQLLFVGLKKAPAIEVNYLRANAPRVLRFEVVEAAARP